MNDLVRSRPPRLAGPDYVSLTTEELRADDLKEAISGTWNT